MRGGILLLVLFCCLGCESTGKIETSLNPYEIERTAQVKVVVELK